jgi:hypothetical protein
MISKSDGSGRARAWILVQADSPQKAAQSLYEELKDQGGDSFVVVRADVVEYHYNIVIPVDAESGEVLRKVYGMIREITGARESAIVPVVEHIPFPPHNAQSYITEKEAEAGEAKEIRPGRQASSPGENAWG